MRRIAVVVFCVCLAAGGSSSAKKAEGNGAQKSVLSPASNGGDPASCTQGSGSARNGFAILNKTGKPEPGTSVVQGEIHIVDRARAGQTLMAFVVPAGSSNCMSDITTSITLNKRGIGNGHVRGSRPNGSYYVTIMQGNNEVLASTAVPLL